MELIEKIKRNLCAANVNTYPLENVEALAQAALTTLIEYAGGDGVTEGDREAAASGYFAWCSGNPVIPDRMKAGQADDHSMVQAFARHRSTAFAAGRAARDREIVEWLRGQDNGRAEGAGYRHAADAIERGEV